MPRDAAELAWDMITDLRKELVELQKIRAQVIGFKIAFVSAGMGIVVVNMDKAPYFLLALPGFAAVFFDLLIDSYSFSIKRTGFYCKKYLEPILRAGYSLPSGHLMWEEFMWRSQSGRNLAVWGNLGITFLTLGLPIYGLFLPPFSPLAKGFIFGCLLTFVIYDAGVLIRPKTFE